MILWTRYLNLRRSKQPGTYTLSCSIASEISANRTSSTLRITIKTVGFVIERLRVRIRAGAAGEFSSPVLTLCADSYSVSVPPPCYRIYTLKIPVILPKMQVAGYT